MVGKAKFTLGQIVHHRLFDYRGVIFDIDFQYEGSDEWYDTIARSRPPKDQPWYHVLVDNADHETYVAERNLESSENAEPIRHPCVALYFSGIKNGLYVPMLRKN
ncbi:MAG: heat shock protein HspQ [Gammaproteobacteria bacterium]